LLLAGTLVGFVSTARAADPVMPPMPPGVAGTLVIVGGGGMPVAIRDRFLELAGGKKARLVIIPTASDKADRPELLKGWGHWRSQDVASVTFLHTRSRDRANDPAFVKPLTEATGVWISGGDQSRLAAAYHDTAVERELQKLLARGGVIGGTSAGASVMSSIMIVGGNPQAQTGTGFGLLPDVVIDQHFENRHRLNRLQGVLSKYPKFLGLGIDEQTAVVIQGGAAWVLGDGHVLICVPGTGPQAPAVRVLKSGDRVDLMALRPGQPKKPAVRDSNTATAAPRAALSVDGPSR
jgi:cyanophycinase